jgi:hypothetical protein
MDRNQRLAVCAAHLALEMLDPATRKKLSDDIGVVLGLEGKTDKSVAAIRRVHADSVTRRLRKRWRETENAIPEAEMEAALGAIAGELRRGRASNAYSLPGLMPNVVSGRVANMLSLRGPNYIVDAGGGSFGAALQFALDMLQQRLCSVVLAGGIGAAVGSSASLLYNHGGRPLAEAAFLLAITTAELAEREGLPVLARISLQKGGPKADRSREPYLAGADGSWETARALDAFRRSGESSTATVGESIVCFSAAAETAAQPERPVSDDISDISDISLTTPVWQMLSRIVSPAAVPESVLLLVDEPEAAAAFAAGDVRITVRSVRDVDLADDAAAGAALRDLDPAAFDLVLAFRDLRRPKTTLRDSQPLLDLLFATTRHFYDRIAAGHTALAALTTTAASERPDPATGLFGGFMKSLARELPNARCRAVHVDAAPSTEVLRHLFDELGRPAGPVEVFYQRNIP